MSTGIDPEDQFRRLKDTSRWKIETPQLRAHPVIRGSVIRRWVIPALAAVIVAALVVLGVQTLRSTPQPAPQPTITNTQTPDPTPTPSSTPTPTSTPTVDPNAQPAQVFDGDCSKILSDADVQALYPDYTLVDKIPDDAQGTIIAPALQGDDFAVRSVGGVTCSWAFKVKGGYTGGPYIAILPASAATPLDKPTECGTGYSEGAYGDQFCGIELEENGYRITGGVSASDGQDRRAMAATIAEKFRAAADAAPAATAPERPSDAWPFVIDCNALAGAIKDYGNAYIGGGDVGPMPGVRALVQNTTNNYYNGCSFDKGPGVSIRGGGGWAYDELAAEPGVEATEVDGYDRALRISTDGSDQLALFRGSNWLIVPTNDGEAKAIAFANAVANALDSGAAPVDNAATDAKITTAGWGEIKIGQPMPADTSLVQWTSPATVCDGVDGYWSAGQGSTATYVRTEDGTKTGRVDVIYINYVQDITTKSGAHPGMTRAELTALLPSAKSADKGRLLVVKDALGQVVFELGAEGDGADDIVGSMTVIPPDLKPTAIKGRGVDLCGTSWP
jgi:hypothetical protein